MRQNFQSDAVATTVQATRIQAGLKINHHMRTHDGLPDSGLSPCS